MTTQNKMLPAVQLLLDSSRGTYIPQHFAQYVIGAGWQGISENDKAALLAGQDDEQDLYWFAWDNVLDKAYFEHNGNTWRLYQDGDLWALCAELMTDEEKHNFGFDEE